MPGETKNEETAPIPWPKILTGVTILVFILQLSGQYGLFVQLPERQKEIFEKVSVIENGMNVGTTKHAVTENRLDTIDELIKRIVARLDEIERVNRDQSSDIRRGDPR